MLYSTRRFVLPCVIFLVMFNPFSIAITSLGEERANLIAFRTFVRFALVLVLTVFSSSSCLGGAAACVWEGLRFLIVALLGLFSYLFCIILFHIYLFIYLFIYFFFFF